MRNWNKFPKGPIFQRDGGFQHTYEELKQDWKKDIMLVFDRFQHTYEELKPGTSELFAYDGAGFQHTYEELKRNNPVTMINPWTQFSAYLWGIETS